MNILFNDVLGENEKIWLLFLFKNMYIHIVYMCFHTHTPSKLLEEMKRIDRISSVQMKTGNRDRTNKQKKQGTYRRTNTTINT